MAQTKKKEIDQKATKTPKVSPQENVKPQTREEGAQQEIWKEELKELSTQSFHSVDEAVSAVIERVVTRLNTPPSQLEQVTQFLHTLFDSDQGLKDTLKRTLKIR